MDGGGRRGRHNEPQVHSSSSGRYTVTNTPQNSRVASNPDADRYRASALTPVSSAPRGPAASASYSTYYSEPTAAFAATGMSSTGLSYGADYSSDARQPSSSFSSYSSAPVMYNVAQPSAAQGQVYDSPAFAPRQSAGGLQMMTPEVASTYFGPETSNTSSHASLPQPNVYQQTSGLGFPSTMSGMNTMPQPTASADISMTEEPDYGDSALEERWINYKRQMASVFQDISNGALQSASETLSAVSDWLLSQVADLGVLIKAPSFSASRKKMSLTRETGLTLDDANLHADRIQLWKNFNHAWLALGRAQKEGLLNGQRPSTLLSADAIQKMVDDLIQLCNGLERHGLLDYGLGVWEERIVEDCMQLFPESSDSRRSSR